MHEELIGQHASLTLPCSVDAAKLLLGFIEELMEASGDEPEEPERLEADLRGAVAALCPAGSDNGASHLVASFNIHDEGVDVRLVIEGDTSGGEKVVVAREI